MNIVYNIKTCNDNEIFFHLKECDNNFIPPLSTRVDLRDFSKKIYEKTITFEAWSETILVGLVSCYYNDPENRSGFINNVSIIKNYMGKGIAANLLNMSIDYAKQNNIVEVKLEVSNNNIAAILLYKKIGFVDLSYKGEFIVMKYILAV